MLIDALTEPDDGDQPLLFVSYADGCENDAPRITCLDPTVYGSPAGQTSERRMASVTARGLAWVRSRPAAMTLALAIGVMIVVLLYVGRWLTFWLDEWLFISDRNAITERTLLQPFLDTLVAAPVIAYNALLATFGMRTYLPYLLLAWAGHVTIVVLLFRIVGRRCGQVLGLMAGLSLLFLGSGFEVLLHPFQIQYLFAAVGGLVAIDQLDRPPVASVVRRRAVLIAAVALVVAIASSGLGVFYAGLILVWALLRRDRASLAATIPAITIYAAWYFTWGRESGRLAGPGLGPLESVYSVLYGMGAALTGLIGLPPERFTFVGLGLLGLMVVVFAGAVLRGYRPDPLVIAAGLALVAMHVLQTFLRGTFGVEHGARSGYVYAGAIFVWLVIAGLTTGRALIVRGRDRTAILVGILLVPMILGNMRQFAGVANLYRTMRATEFAELRLMEELRDTPGLRLDAIPDGDLLTYVSPRLYFTAIDRYGRPTLTGDWERYVDQAAVEAARARLLEP